MRHWIFHPVIFYPLVIVIGVLAVLLSLEPQNWPRKPAPVAAQHVGGSLIWSGEGFNSPDVGPEQRLTVMRDLLGHAQSLHIAQVPSQPPPTPAEQGVRILFTPADAALLEGKAVTVEVTYNPLPVNAANQMAVSIQGIGPAVWQTDPSPSPPSGPLKFELPAQMAPEGVGIRVITGAGGDEAFGLEITKVKLTPHN